MTNKINFDFYQFINSIAYLDNELTTISARRGKVVQIRGNSHRPKLSLPFGDCLGHGDTFGANGARVGRVLNVASLVDGAIDREDGRAHRELTVRTVGAGLGTSRGGDQFLDRLRI